MEGPLADFGRHFKSFCDRRRPARYNAWPSTDDSLRDELFVWRLPHGIVFSQSRVKLVVSSLHSDKMLPLDPSCVRGKSALVAVA